MRLSVLTEMAAKKLCPICGKSMAGNHYYYKGAWKCKKENIPSTNPNTTTAPTLTPPTIPATTAVSPPAEPVAQSAIGKQVMQDKADETTTVEQQPLEVTIEIIDAAKPYLDKEIEKINKIATKIGAKSVEVVVVSSHFKNMTRPDENNPKRTIRYKVKVLVISLKGSTPKIQAADGTYWNFIGVVTPSAAGKAILKLTPDASDNESVRKLYDTNPYYCDHCKKIRNRNETFIVQSGNDYKQVGRSCLRAFVGGTNPQALLDFFAWFANPAQLQSYIDAKMTQTSNGGGGSSREESYYDPIELLKYTCAVVSYRKGYVSSKAANGRSTSSDVRMLLWGAPGGLYTTPQEKQDWINMDNLASTPAIEKEAQDILDWFTALPQATKDENTFYKNIDIMVGENAVGSRQVGYIVGLYPAHQRATDNVPVKGPALVKEWPTQWGNNPQPVTDKHATVKFIRTIEGPYGTTLVFNIMFDDGLGASWKYSGAQDVRVGDEFLITGTLEPDTYFTPPRIKFIPDRKWLRGSFKQQVEKLA